MMRFFKMIALLMALLIMSSPAWSWNSTDHVSQAPNGQGDVLIYPVYFGFDGFQTKLQVINTSLDMSAVAKVVIRSPLYSQEVLDFFIFLSPTDVWDGFIRWNAEGEFTYIYSDDPSVLISVNPTTFASAETPLQVPLAQPRCGDTNEYGYAEVFLTWVFPNDTPGTTKLSIFNRFIGDGSVLAPAPTAGDAPGDLLESNTNILAGFLQLQAPLFGLDAGLNVTTLKDYRTTTAEGLTETVFGQAARNSMVEVEAALAKNFIGMPYVNNEEGGTLHVFTFPTKLTVLGQNCGQTHRGLYEGFGDVPYSLRAMDMEEETIVGVGPIFSPFDPEEEFDFPFEVNALIPTAFEKGWYRYTLGSVVDDEMLTTSGPVQSSTEANPQNITYAGAPVIPTVWNFNFAGPNTFSGMYGVWSDGPVYCEDADGVELVGYQYLRENLEFCHQDVNNGPTVSAE